MYYIEDMSWIRSLETDEQVIREFKWGMTLKSSQPILKIIPTNLPKELKVAFNQALRDHKKQMLAFPTKTELRILAYLIDDRGHPHWDIAEELRLDEGYTTNTIKKLLVRGLIYRGEKRPSTNRKARSRKSPEKRLEIPYYINKELNILSDLRNRVDLRLEHLGAKASPPLMMLSNWLEHTQENCMMVGEGIRLNARPYTDNEIRALGMGRWPPILWNEKFK